MDAQMIDNTDPTVPQATAPSTPTAPTPAPTGPPPGVTFDDAPVQASATPPPGVVFDADPVPGAPSTATGTTSPNAAPVPDALHLDASNNVFLRSAKAINSIGAGVGSGVLDTLTGIGNISNKLDDKFGMPGRAARHAAVDLLQQRQQELDQQNRENPFLAGTGKLTDGVVEFLTGDELAKGLALSDKYLQAAKVAKFIESASPRVLKALEIGTNALRSGVAQGGVTTLKTGGDVGQGAEQGLLGAGVTGALGAAGVGIKAIRSALDIGAIQKPLQGGVRSVLNDVAEKFGVNPPSAASIRDTAQGVSDAIRGKASSMYDTLDQISGGRAQRFREASKAISDELSSIVDLDDEREAALELKRQEIDEAHKAFLDELAAKGHDPDMLQQADAIWTQQNALRDLGAAVRQSTSGMRPDMAGPGSTPEALNPKVLFVKLNRLNDRGRLAQAIGTDNARAILNMTDQALVQAQRIAARNEFAKSLGKAVGLGGAGGLAYKAVAGIHHLLGDDSK